MVPNLPRAVRAFGMVGGAPLIIQLWEWSIEEIARRFISRAGGLARKNEVPHFSRKARAQDAAGMNADNQYE
jgi:hypothetical protein